MPVVGLLDPNEIPSPEAYASDDAPSDSEGEEEVVKSAPSSPPRRTDDSLAALANESSLAREPSRPSSSSPYAPDDDDDASGNSSIIEGGGGGWGGDDAMETGFDDFVNTRQHEEEEKRRVMNLLSQIEDLEQRGYVAPKRFNYTSDPDEMYHVVQMGQESLKRRSGAAISKKLLTGATGLIELVNHTYDPFGAKLDGFSDSVTNSIDDYEEVLYRIWRLYGQSFGEQHPLIELFVMLGLTAAQTHMMNSWAEKHIQQQQQQQQPQQPQPQPQQQQQQQQQPSRPRESRARAPAPAKTPVDLVPGLSMAEVGNMINRTHASGAQDVVPFPDSTSESTSPLDSLDAALADAQDQAESIQITIPDGAATKQTTRGARDVQLVTS